MPSDSFTFTGTVFKIGNDKFRARIVSHKQNIECVSESVNGHDAFFGAMAEFELKLKSDGVI